MWHNGINLLRTTVVIAAVDDSGRATEPVRFACQDTAAIVRAVERLKPFRAVVEATSAYRWLYDLLPPTTRSLSPTRSASARWSSAGRRPTGSTASCPPTSSGSTRSPSLTSRPSPTSGSARSPGSAGKADAKIGLRALLASHNHFAPYRVPFGPRGPAWFTKQGFGAVDVDVRDELLARVAHYRKQIAAVDARLEALKGEFPQVEALLELRGVGLFTAMVVVAELGEVGRFRSAKQVGAYAGPTARVRRSGERRRHGAITREGSPLLRWVLTEAATKVIKGDDSLRNFYTRIRKRSNTKTARIAVARKLAEICWKRLRRWQREKEAAAA